MTASLRFLTAALLLTGSLLAQVTGVPGKNDYTINGSTSGSQSCNTLCLPSPVVMNLSVNTVPGNLVIIVFTDCPCRGCSIPWPSNTCSPALPLGFIPPCNTTNQSIDFFPIPGCNIVWSATLVADAAGNANISVAVPPILAGTVPCTLNTTLSTQAVIFDPCGLGDAPLGAGPFVLSQAYSVGF